MKLGYFIWIFFSFYCVGKRGKNECGVKPWVVLFVALKLGKLKKSQRYLGNETAIRKNMVMRFEIVYRQYNSHFI